MSPALNKLLQLRLLILKVRLREKKPSAAAVGYCGRVGALESFTLGSKVPILRQETSLPQDTSIPLNFPDFFGSEWLSGYHKGCGCPLGSTALRILTPEAGNQVRVDLGILRAESASRARVLALSKRNSALTPLSGGWCVSKMLIAFSVVRRISSLEKYPSRFLPALKNTLASRDLTHEEYD